MNNDYIDYERYSTIRHFAMLDSKQTKETVYAFSNGKTYIVYNPLSAKHCIEEMNKAGHYLIGRYRDGKEV